MVTANRPKWRWRRFAAAVLGVPIMVLSIALLIGSFVPRNRDWRRPAYQKDELRVDVVLSTNGVHTALIVPIRNDIADFTDLVRRDHIANPADYGTHIQIGWGEAGFYRHTQTWVDVDVARVATALTGSDEVLLHVDHLTWPSDNQDRRVIVMRGGEYRRLARDLRSWFFVSDGATRAEPAYGPRDVFYASRGHYSAMHNCNQWVADRLASAGVKAPLWAPFQGGVMHYYPSSPPPVIE